MHATDNSTGTGIYIGTSGWSNDHWKGPFYPEDLPSDQRLTYYSRHFSTLEINNSFYTSFVYGLPSILISPNDYPSTVMSKPLPVPSH